MSHPTRIRDFVPEPRLGLGPTLKDSKLLKKDIGSPVCHVATLVLLLPAQEPCHGIVVDVSQRRTQHGLVYAVAQEERLDPVGHLGAVLDGVDAPDELSRFLLDFCAIPLARGIVCLGLFIKSTMSATSPDLRFPPVTFFVVLFAISFSCSNLASNLAPAQYVPFNVADH